MTTAIVWFRRDLRLTDNPALSAAIAQCRAIIPLYIDLSGDGSPWQPGAASRWWLNQSLERLDRSLQARSSRLVLKRGDAKQVLDQLISRHRVTHIFWNRRYTPDDAEQEREIKQWLISIHIHCESFNASLLAEPWQIENSTGQPFRVFTPFWRRYTPQLVSIPAPLAAPERVPPLPKQIDALPLHQLELMPTIDWYQGMASTWRPGEAGALERLAQFTELHVEDYTNSRDLPGVEGSSRLSPHLHFGEVGPRQIFFALRSHAMTDEARIQPYLRQLGWREFAYHLLYHFPHTRQAPLNSKFERYPWLRMAASADRLAAWQRGETGIPIVDAGMRELWQTGWMHNRVRMIVASLLTKNLGIHWLEGARWFWDTLVDADLANNTLGWQWTAGCGADAAPFFRIFNPVRQGERFDADGRYVRRWVPELAALSDKAIHAPWLATPSVLTDAGVTLGRDYPAPIVDLKTSRAKALSYWNQIK